MDKLNQTFLLALKTALKGEQLPDQPGLTPGDWEQIFRTAQRHQLLPVIYETVYTQNVLCPEHAPFIGRIKHTVIQQVTIQTMRTNASVSLYRHLRSAGVTPLVVKGIICRNLYPNPDHRISGDEDLLIPPAQFPICHEAMMAYGMETPEDPENFDKVYEIPYGKKGSPIYIELHTHLFPPENDAYGDLNWFFEDIHSRAVEETIDGVKVMTMPPTDHLFYLICHAFKHFLHSGFGIRQVCDIIMYANAYGAQIQWDTVLLNCQAIRADKFAAAMFRMGEIYLTFDPQKACWPDCWRSIDVDCEPMLADLLSAGVFGAADKNRKHSSNITLSAVSDQKQGRRASSGLMNSLFPSSDKLESRYTYLKKHPSLLPLAWIQRVLDYSKHNSRAEAAASLKIGSERVELMKQYDILD